MRFNRRAHDFCRRAYIRQDLAQTKNMHKKFSLSKTTKKEKKEDKCLYELPMSVNHDITSKCHGFLLFLLQSENTISEHIKVSQISGELV